PWSTFLTVTLWILIFLLTRHRPIPKPFPYTTLFRSRPVRQVNRAATLGGFLVELRVRLHILAHVRDRDPGAIILALALDPHRVVDRKSTRLNSSHVKSSYAVFCLKKKQICMRQNNRT